MTPKADCIKAHFPRLGSSQPNQARRPVPISPLSRAPFDTLAPVPTSPFILAIEISNPGAPGAGVAIGRLSGSTVESLAIEPVLPSGRGGHDDDLMPAIARLCARAGFDPRSAQLARVAVSVGPGGYTSVRVACAVGKMIAEASGAACVAVPTARVVLESAPKPLADGVAVALAGKGDSAWVQTFTGGREAGDGRLMTAADVPSLIEAGVRTIIADRFLPAPMRDAATAAGITMHEPVLDAAACLRLGAILPTIDPVELVPIYPREPDAVTLWRNRKK